MRELVFIHLQKIMWKPFFIWYYRFSSLSHTDLSPSQHSTLLPRAKAMLFSYVNLPSVQTFSQNIILLASYIYKFCSPHFNSAFPVALQNGMIFFLKYLIWRWNKALFVFSLCGKEIQQTVKFTMCTLPQALSAVVPCKDHATHATQQQQDRII